MNKDEIFQAISSMSIRKAAIHLNTSLTNLRYWIKKHDITKPQKTHSCKCGETDPKQFYRVSGKCKKCFNRYCTERWIKRKLKAIEYKGGKCQRCSYDNHYAALEFHHVDRSGKDADWTKLRLRSWSDIIEELDKCELLCANCHREVHAEWSP